MCAKPFGMTICEAGVYSGTLVGTIIGVVQPAHCVTSSSFTLNIIYLIIIGLIVGFIYAFFIICLTVIFQEIVQKIKNNDNLSLENTNLYVSKSVFWGVVASGICFVFTSWEWALITATLITFNIMLCLLIKQMKN